MGRVGLGVGCGENIEAQYAGMAVVGIDISLLPPVFTLLPHVFTDPCTHKFVAHVVRGIRFPIIPGLRPDSSGSRSFTCCSRN